MSERIYLGVTKEYNERIYLSKHSWDCGWYWGFGYLGNNTCHYHFDSYLDGKHFKIEEVFKDTYLTQENWWKILELFSQAYNLKYAYETYYRGSANITGVPFGGITKDLNMANRIQNDMEKILCDVWEYIKSLEGVQNVK